MCNAEEFYVLWKWLALCVLVGSCSKIEVPPQFVYREVQTRDFEIATWQKILDPQGTYKFYIEGDGYAYNAHGRPSSDPTPREIFVRELAFGDPNPNVIYLSRPCQYIKRGICAKRHWTTARFAPEIINAEYDAVKQIAGENEVILIGFSGGAQIAGLIAAAKPGLNVKKIITIAGNLDHLSWTQYHNLPPLNESLDLESYRRQYLQIPQINYAGSKDEVVPPALIKAFAGEKLIRIVPDATHGQGWESIYNDIWVEN